MSDYIQIGQVYVSCNARETGDEGGPRRIRIVGIVGPNRVEVETIDDAGVGTRRRHMWTDNLHASLLTLRGVARTQGYVLETEAAQ
ncbi:MAG: hypothetical protein HOQ43_10785 [Glycomyces artemisiae]|uniref:Uncharacterized protein n=1 Tax=Glycomyces artemisiae TaxID=1076443 RepID=A0A850C3Q8_9ACTN|nr:hypothetical protein [Glycomyces artemisiae]